MMKLKSPCLPGVLRGAWAVYGVNAVDDSQKLTASSVLVENADINQGYSSPDINITKCKETITWVDVGKESDFVFGILIWIIVITVHTSVERNVNGISYLENDTGLICWKWFIFNGGLLLAIISGFQ
jgi:hypothetical protein